MKKRSQWILIVLVGLFLASCATAPPEPAPVEETIVVVEPAPEPEPAPVAPVVVDRTAVNAAKANADKAKMKADSVKAAKAAPVEYQGAVALYTKAGESDKSEALEAAITGYNSAAAGFLSSADKADKARMAALEAMNKLTKRFPTPRPLLTRLIKKQQGGLNNHEKTTYGIYASRGCRDDSVIPVAPDG